MTAKGDHYRTTGDGLNSPFKDGKMRDQKMKGSRPAPDVKSRQDAIGMTKQPARKGTKAV